jgi:hypothetical protein
VDLVDETRAQVLLDRVRPAADAHVPSAGGLACPLERLVDAAGDEMERRAALHLEGRARVMGQHEHRHVVRRVLAPPALPAHVGPRPAYRPEHVPAEDPRADELEAARGEVVVEPRRAALLAEHDALERARRERPLVQVGAAHAERVFEVLARTRPVAVGRDGEALHANPCHSLASIRIEAGRRAAAPRNPRVGRDSTRA